MIYWHWLTCNSIQYILHNLFSRKNWKKIISITVQITILYLYCQSNSCFFSQNLYDNNASLYENKKGVKSGCRRMETFIAISRKNYRELKRSLEPIEHFQEQWKSKWRVILMIHFWGPQTNVCMVFLWPRSELTEIHQVIFWRRERTLLKMSHIGGRLRVPLIQNFR